MRRIWLGGPVALLSTIAGALAVYTACTTPPETTYGNPNSLDRKNLPGDGGVEPLGCSADGGGGDAGSFDGGCPSFKKDIYPAFTPTGAWRCSDKACHGGATAPPIDGGTPEACLASLRKIVLNNQPYVSPDGGKDPNASAILCNLQGTCGSKMPQPPGADPTSDELCKLQAWLACGAPNN